MENERNKGFKRKTIISIIKYKMDNWIRSIKNTELQEKIQNSYILTGGAIASMLMGEMPNDFDVYFDDVDVCEKVAKYYVDQYKGKARSNERIGNIIVNKLDNRVEICIKSAGVIGSGVNVENYQYFETEPDQNHIEEAIVDFIGRPNNSSDVDKGNYDAMFITSNAISLTDSVQIITRFVGDPEEIHKNFDYVHATNYYSKKTGLVLKQCSLESIIAKDLKYVGSLYPLASLFRMRKFISRGWTINVGEILKISWDINQLDLKDLNVLKDQLTGVDVTYFQDLMRVLEQHTNSGQEIERNYLVELIDKIFD